MTDASIETKFYSADQNELPRAGDAAVLDQLVRELHAQGVRKGPVEARQIRLTQTFADAHFDTITRFASATSSFTYERMCAAQADLENRILTPYAQLYCDAINDATSLLEQHETVFRAAVRRHFVPYRKHMAWLAEAAQRARAEIAGIIARQMNLYEDDGDLLLRIDVCLYRYPIRELVESLPDSAVEQRNDGSALEQAVASSLAAIGFTVQKTGASGDQGADVLAQKEGLSYAIQCKDYGTSVGNAAIQQALSAKLFYKADYAVVCTNGSYTKSARELAASTGVILITPDLLCEIEKLRLLVD